MISSPLSARVAGVKNSGVTHDVSVGEQMWHLKMGEKHIKQAHTTGENKTAHCIYIQRVTKHWFTMLASVIIIIVNPPKFGSFMSVEELD